MPGFENIPGIEKERHRFIGVGAVNIHPQYRQTGDIYVCLGKERHGREISFSELNSPTRNTAFAPKLAGQWSIVLETVRPDLDINYQAALARMLGKTRPETGHTIPGEEISGLIFPHALDRYHLNTVWFATKTGEVAPGTEDTACVTWVEFPKNADLRPGSNCDMDRPVWLKLADLLDPTKYLQETIVERSSPRVIPQNPDYPLDPRVEKRAVRFALEYFGHHRKVPTVDLGCLAMRPGVLQILEDLPEFIQRRRYPIVHKFLKYCPQLGLYKNYE